MKTILILLLSTCCCFAQGVKGIVVSSQQANEPPSIPAPALYKIYFKETSNGDLVASVAEEHAKKIKKIKLAGSITLSKDKIAQTITWIDTNKTSFPITALNIDPLLINNELEFYPLTFTKTVDKDLVIKTDSFNVCRPFIWKMSHSTGGNNLTVTVKMDDGVEAVFAFESADFETNRFKLQEYLILYPLFEGKLPADHIASEFFNKEVLSKALVYYLHTIECENFYYKEFISKYPERTPQENRLKVGWNFEEYMNSRAKQ